MNLKKYKAIIFDLFHNLTSVKSTRAAEKEVNEVLRVTKKD